MDYNELLLAAAVRDLAAQIKNGKAGDYWKVISDAPDREQKRKQWDIENPTLAFVPEALAQLKAVAEVMRAEKS